VRHHGDPLDELHRASIDAIRASGLEWALVSPSSVMETSLALAGARDPGFQREFACAGVGRVGLVAADDVARAAAVVLIERDEDGANYELTGPESLSMADRAAVLTRVLGRTITSNNMPEDDFGGCWWTRGGIPPDEVDIKAISIYATGGTVTRTLSPIPTGR
jgi:uncharacterized protein YbjT (DUF2867 family)